MERDEVKKFGFLYLMFDCFLRAKGRGSTFLYLDSGCSRHMSGDEKQFTDPHPMMVEMLPSKTITKVLLLVSVRLVSNFHKLLMIYIMLISYNIIC